MKYLILLAFFPVCTWASESSHSYVWHRISNGQDQVLKYKVTGKDDADSLTDAAFYCVEFFQKRSNLSLDERIDLIDICVNPKEKN